MRRRMSAVTERAIDQVMGWRAQGVPSYVTRYEAHALTNGAVGEPRTEKNSWRAMHLLDVALAAKQAEKKGGER